MESNTESKAKYARLVLLIPVEKQEAFRKKVKEEGRKQCWIMERAIDDYLKNGIPQD